MTRGGRRCGKGEGYSDLEYASLRELGHPPVPVATTVHRVQILDEFPRDPTDLPLTVIATPEKVIRVRRHSKGHQVASTGINFQKKIWTLCPCFRNCVPLHTQETKPAAHVQNVEHLSHYSRQVAFNRLTALYTLKQVPDSLVAFKIFTSASRSSP